MRPFSLSYGPTCIAAFKPARMTVWLLNAAFGGTCSKLNLPTVPQMWHVPVTGFLDIPVTYLLTLSHEPQESLDSEFPFDLLEPIALVGDSGNLTPSVRLRY